MRTHKKNNAKGPSNRVRPTTIRYENEHPLYVIPEDPRGWAGCFALYSLTANTSDPAAHPCCDPLAWNTLTGSALDRRKTRNTD